MVELAPTTRGWRLLQTKAAARDADLLLSQDPEHFYSQVRPPATADPTSRIQLLKESLMPFHGQRCHQTIVRRSTSHRTAVTGVILAVVAILAAPAIAGPGASGGPVYWTTAQAKAATSVGPNGASYWTITPRAGAFPRVADAATLHVNSVSCAGVGATRSGAYPAFHCAVLWSDPHDTSGLQTTSRLWVRVWRMPGGSAVCGDDRSILYCPPPPAGKPLPHDPRTAGPRSGSVMGAEAKQLTLSRLGAKAPATFNFECAPRAYFTWRCTWADGAGTIHSSTTSWVRGKSAWSRSVQLRG